ncbi:MAG: TetR/AcrR family transcriptional regulator, partial [Pseudomonadota bacterium]|nr:TetR/AcrR family transcriptional regulator [Pseudomonadota bacterium]
GPPPAPRRSPKGDRRRKELVAIATRLFAGKGFDKTSLQDIADEAGLTKAAVYYHFPDKARLYEAVVVSRLAENYAQVLAAVDLADGPLGKLEAFVRTSARRIDEDRAGWVASSSIYRALGPQDLAPAILAGRDRLERLLREIIAGAVEAGELRDIDPAMLGRLLYSALNHIPRWHSPTGRLSAEMVAMQYLDMVIEGARRR